MRPTNRARTALRAGAWLLAATALAGCERERTAEAETSVSEAEVSTELPPAAVSEQQLEATADAAAVVAATPPPTVVVPAPGTAAAPGAAPPASGTGAMSGQGSASQPAPSAPN